MTFTYDLANADATKVLISKVRLELGDTVANKGMRPDGSNLSDEEISVWLAAESNHIMHTVTRACDALARMWANMADVTVGPRSEGFSKISSDWADRAQELRKQYGDPGGGSAFSISGDRVDGYSLEADKKKTG